MLPATVQHHQEWKPFVMLRGRLAVKLELPRSGGPVTTPGIQAPAPGGAACLEATGWSARLTTQVHAFMAWCVIDSTLRSNTFAHAGGRRLVFIRGLLRWTRSLLS